MSHIDPKMCFNISPMFTSNTFCRSDFNIQITISDNLSNDLHPKCSIKSGISGPTANPEVRNPVELKHIHVGDTKVRSKLRFEVVTARVIETGGKKHVVSFFKFVKWAVYTKCLLVLHLQNEVR